MQLGTKSFTPRKNLSGRKNLCLPQKRTLPVLMHSIYAETARSNMIYLNERAVSI